VRIWGPILEKIIPALGDDFGYIKTAEQHSEVGDFALTDLDALQRWVAAESRTSSKPLRLEVEQYTDLSDPLRDTAPSDHNYTIKIAPREKSDFPKGVCTMLGKLCLTNGVFAYQPNTVVPGAETPEVIDSTIEGILTTQDNTEVPLGPVILHADDEVLNEQDTDDEVYSSADDEEYSGSSYNESSEDAEDAEDEEESVEQSDSEEQSFEEKQEIEPAYAEEHSSSEVFTENNFDQGEIGYQGHGTSDDEVQEQRFSDEFTDNDEEQANFEDFSENPTDSDLSEKGFVPYISNQTSDDEEQANFEDFSEVFTDDDLHEEVVVAYTSNGTSDDEGEQEDLSEEAEPEYDRVEAESDEPQASQDPTSELTLTSEPEMPKDSFVGRFYTDAAGKKYLVIGRRVAAEHGCLHVSSEEFVHHVGPILDEFVTRCGRNFGGILTTDFASENALVPLFLSDVVALKEWINLQKTRLRLGHTILFDSKGYPGCAIKIISENSLILPKSLIKFNHEGVFCNGQILGMVRDGQFVTNE
jgi:hypothetical protein